MLWKIPVDSSMIDAYVSHVCSLITASTRSLQLSLQLYHYSDMPKSLEHRRKGRSRLQRAHDHQRLTNGQYAPVDQPGVPGCGDSPCRALPNSGAIALGLSIPSAFNKDVIIKDMNKRCDLLYKRLKNTLQRERRAKHKVSYYMTRGNNKFTFYSFPIACGSEGGCYWRIYTAQG